MINFIRTKDNLTLFWDGKTKVVPTGTAAFNDVIRLIKLNANPVTILAACDLSDRVKLKCHSSGLFSTDEDGNVWVGNDKVAKGLSDRIVDFVEEGLPFAPLVSLWHNIMQNPDPRARADLYEFLQHNGHPITEDGCFIAYKRVRENFMDHYTNTIDNSVGASPSMRREDVDCDPSRTCSRGLHVACLSYAVDMYQGGNGRLICVKVHPKNVCAIPTDYNKTKMRTCGYDVISIHELDVPLKHSLVDKQLKPMKQAAPASDTGEDLDADVVLKESRNARSKPIPVPANKAVKNAGWENLRDSKGRFYRKHK
jgi:hypothetical protein